MVPGFRHPGGGEEDDAVAVDEIGEHQKRIPIVIMMSCQPYLIYFSLLVQLLLRNRYFLNPFVCVKVRSRGGSLKDPQSRLTDTGAHLPAHQFLALDSEPAYHT